LKPADFIEITYSGGEGLGNGTGQTFTLESYIGGTIASNAVVGGEGFITSVDPPTPGAAPEPGTLALFGSALAGLVGFRRRKA
jgi:hypothetical protein